MIAIPDRIQAEVLLADRYFLEARRFAECGDDEQADRMREKAAGIYDRLLFDAKRRDDMKIKTIHNHGLTCENCQRRADVRVTYDELNDKVTKNLCNSCLDELVERLASEVEG